MDNIKIQEVKTAFEIGALVGKLNLKNQSYVMNTINTLLYAQQTEELNNKKES